MVFKSISGKATVGPKLSVLPIVFVLILLALMALSPLAFVDKGPNPLPSVSSQILP